MFEIWELVDKNKNKTGIFHERKKEKIFPEGLYHMIVEVWVKTPSNKILITKRHPDKNYGLMWECTGGAVVAGEETIDAAVRELHEETGILAQKEQMTYLGDTFRKDHIIDTYLCKLDDENPKLNLQLTEVIDGRFVPIEEMEQYKDNFIDREWNNFIRFKDQIINM